MYSSLMFIRNALFLTILTPAASLHLATSDLLAHAQPLFPDPTAYMPGEGLDPSIVTMVPHMLGPDSCASGASFNPSIARLPQGIRSTLEVKGITNAQYVASFRRTGGQCNNEYFHRQCDAKQRTTRRTQTSLALLDANLNSITKFARVHVDCEDVRLSFENETLLFSCMTYGPALWHLREATFVDGAFSFAAEDSFLFKGGRNFGVISQGGKRYAITWIVAPGSEPDPFELRTKRCRSFKLHNNINPVKLEDGSAYLGVAHEHAEKHGTFAKWGSRYYHYFVLMDATFPFTVKRISPRFCIPAIGNTSSCEIIQFVMAVVQQSEDLLITYGIQDCESAVVRVKLAEVLNFIGKNERSAKLQSAAQPLEAVEKLGKFAKDASYIHECDK